MARLNQIELAAMNTPLRRAMQRFYELPVFEAMLRRAGVSLDGARILDAGCGSGNSTRLLAQRFRPRRLVGFDLMPEQIERARALRLPGVELRVEDVTAIGEPAGAFDAVFVFGILHHVPAWRQALAELARVLAPGGSLLVEEIHGRVVAFEDRLFGTAHPREARFDWPAFRGGLAAAGFTVLAERRLAWDAARSFLARRGP